MYGDSRIHLMAFRDGGLIREERGRLEIPSIRSHEELRQLKGEISELWTQALASLTCDQLSRKISYPEGDFTHQLWNIYDEHWHHRGQLTVYLRCLGIQPPEW